MILSSIICCYRHDNDIGFVALFMLAVLLFYLLFLVTIGSTSNITIKACLCSSAVVIIHIIFSVLLVIIIVFLVFIFSFIIVMISAFLIFLFLIIVSCNNLYKHHTLGLRNRCCVLERNSSRPPFSVVCLCENMFCLFVGTVVLMCQIFVVTSACVKK